ncbi:MAG TPA: T9SS type A sorting domain-containing protein, partial [Saprospiraceae bacterium]|nr:T9SS type A sorting domain-containing protein [Saprospiraceae bacterium]
TPQKDDDHQNGVSTFDLVLISKHILGVQPLNSPYQQIAADINKSGTVTTLDLIQLRKLILNIDSEFSNNTSWRFVDGDYTFSDPDNPLAESFPEVKNFNNLEGEEVADFMAIKVGDVNGSAIRDVQPRSSEAFTIDVDAPQQLQAGETYEVAFTAQDLAAVSGYQFTLQWNSALVEVEQIEEGVAREEHFGVFREEGVITTSWNASEVRNAEFGMRKGEDAVLFSLTLMVRADVPIEQVLQLSSRYTAAEAYNAANDEVMDVALQFGEVSAQRANTLYQNVPNPFQSETVIGFRLAQDTEATLTVRDVTGRLLKVVEGDFVQGYNEVRLTSADLPETGVFYYTLEVGEFTATRKMIIVE